MRYIGRQVGIFAHLPPDIAHFFCFSLLDSGYHLFKTCRVMIKNFVGREREQAVLQATLDSHESEMVAVIGRRRP